MGLSIRDRETERLARELARATGETLTQTVRKALEERLARERRRPRKALIAQRLDEILRRVDALPPLDLRTETEILG